MNELVEKIIFSDNLPDNLTFPEAYKLFFNIVKCKMNFNPND